jgi:hypothetical protein
MSSPIAASDIDISPLEETKHGHEPIKPRKGFVYFLAGGWRAYARRYASLTLLPDPVEQIFRAVILDPDVINWPRYGRGNANC